MVNKWFRTLLQTQSFRCLPANQRHDSDGYKSIEKIRNGKFYVKYGKRLSQNGRMLQMKPGRQSPVFWRLIG